MGLFRFLTGSLFELPGPRDCCTFLKAITSLEASNGRKSIPPRHGGWVGCDHIGAQTSSGGQIEMLLLRLLTRKWNMSVCVPQTKTVQFRPHRPPADCPRESPHHPRAGRRRRRRCVRWSARREALLGLGDCPRRSSDCPT